MVRFHFIIASDALVIMYSIVSCSVPKLAQIQFQVDLLFYSLRIPMGYRVSQSARSLLEQLAILFSMLELPVSREAAIANSEGDLCNVIFDFFANSPSCGRPLSHKAMHLIELERISYAT